MTTHLAIQSSLIVALALGLPVPEWAGRPVAQRLELLDLRERWDGADTRSRAFEGARLPRLAEANRLPPKDFCADCIIFNRGYANWLEGRKITNPDQNYMPWIKRNEEIRTWWYAAKDAQTEYYYDIVRRRALGQCRDMLGLRAWFFGEFPQSVPLELFEEIP